MSKNTTTRFAFGTPDRPGSGVWRVTAQRKTGDVYLNHVPEMANELHVSLHASGRFSVKLNRDRHKLEPPCLDRTTGLYWALVVFFRDWSCALPPLNATGRTSAIQWIGWPEPGSVFAVKFLYSNPDCRFVLGPTEQRIGPPMPAKLFNSKTLLHIICETRVMSAEERSAPPVKEWPWEKSDSYTAGEMIRFTKTVLQPANTPISCIIHEKTK